jgi:hypothetical protein
VADNVLSLLFEINADPTHASAVMKLFEEQVAASLGISGKSFHQFNVAAVEAGKDLFYIGGAAVALGTAVFATAEKTAHLAEAVGHVAEKSGATTEQISTLKFEADRLGGSFESVDHGLTFLSRNLGQFAEGQGKNAKKALDDLGISATDAHGRTIPLRDLLPQIVERLGNMEAGSRRTADTVALFGRGGAALLPVFAGMRQGFADVEKQAAALGVVITEKDIVASRQFLIEQRQLTAQLNAVALTIGREVMPWFTQLGIRLQTFPLLLEQMAMSAAKLAVYLGALPSAGASLLLPLINKNIADTTKEMDQAITNGLIKLDAEAKAAMAAGMALGDTGAAGGGKGGAGSGKSLATGAKEATLAIQGLAQAIPTHYERAPLRG